jgi:hypothetical protein
LQVTSVPSGSELARPFLPAKDFGLSKRFYETIGFEKLFDGDAAIFPIGTSRFILQNRFEKEWAANFVMQLTVDDLDSWWRHIEELDLPTGFGVPEPQAPAVQLWVCASILGWIFPVFFGMWRSGARDFIRFPSQTRARSSEGFRSGDSLRTSMLARP